MLRFTQRPDESEFNPFYAGYLASVPDGDVLTFLGHQHDELVGVMRRLTAEQQDHRYVEGKWSVKEVLGHMVDTEWIFASRMLWISRGDTTALPGMDQDEFMAGADFANRDLNGLSAEFDGLRRATLSLAGSFSAEVLDRTGTASGFLISVRALLWIIAGHCQHHLNILHERYGIDHA